jgi:hypothetical protein
MKKLITVFMLTLALNFIAVAGGVGYLFNKGNLNKDKVQAIREIVFPEPVEPAPATQPSDGPTSQPASLNFDQLLASASGRAATEQVDFIRKAFDSQMFLLDRRERQINDLQRQVELSRSQVERDRAALQAQEKALNDRMTQATKLASDQGFQDSLTLYNSLPAKQVKSIFLDLEDATMMSYLQAMEPRAASKIMKEFKSPEELKRIGSIMEQMRLAQANAKE